MNCLTHNGMWLLLIGVIAALVGGPLAFVGGGLIGVVGLFLSRWLQPLSRLSLWGYALCWLSISFVPFVFWLHVFTGWRNPKYDVALFAIYSACVAVWLSVASKWIKQPSHSRLRAILIALAGAVTLAPALIVWGQGSIAPVPIGLAIGFYALGWHNNGAVPPPSLEIMVGFVGAIPVFLGMLVVQWPGRSTTEPLDGAIT